MQLYIVRYATPANQTGHPALSADGQQQADQLGALFNRLSLAGGSVAVLASTLRRARQTAVAIRAAVGVAEGAIRTFHPVGAPLPPSPDGALNSLALEFRRP